MENDERIARQSGNQLPIDIADMFGVPHGFRIYAMAGQRVDTSRDYLKRMCDWARRWGAERRGRSGDAMLDMTDWLINRTPEMMGNSWRLHRAAISHVFAQIGGETALEAIARMKAVPSSAAGTALRGRRKKHKVVPDDDLDVMIRELLKSKNRWSDLVAKMLMAGRMTGLRPNEWWSAKLSRRDSEPVLEVLNAKFRADRACGETRVISLAPFSKDEVTVIRILIEGLRSLDGSKSDRDRVYMNCRNIFRRVQQKLWPNRKMCYVLYSLRHTVAAELKAVEPPRSVAAVMGHASPRTANIHYARKKRGSSGSSGMPIPLPTEETLAHVRDLPVTRAERLAARSHSKEGGAPVAAGDNGSAPSEGPSF